VFGVDFSALVDLADLAIEAAFDGLSPCDVSVTLDDGVAGAEIEGLIRVQGGVNAPIDDKCPIVEGSNCSRVSSVMRGSPYSEGVAAAKT